MRCSSRIIKIPVHAVQPRVWDVLHLGAFQLVFLTQVPKHAAVYETVELTTHCRQPQSQGVRQQRAEANLRNW